MTNVSAAEQRGTGQLSVEQRRGIAVGLAYLVLTLICTWPLPVQLGTHMLGTGTDPDLYMWTLGWNAHAFLAQPWAIFDANIFHPSKYSLAYSENLIGSSLLFAPLLWLTDDLLLVTNLVELSSVWLSAIGAYLLGRKLGLGVTAALIVGLIFGFSPARFFRMPQVHVTTVQWMPFCLAYLHTYFGPGGRPRHLRLAAAFYTAQALASGHGAVFLTVAAVGYLAWRLALGERIDVLRRIRDLGVSGALLLAPAVLLLLPYRSARREVPNLQRTLDDFGSSLSSYFSSPTHVHEWMLSHAPAWMTAARPDAHLFPGVLPIVLAIVAAVAMRHWSSTGGAHGRTSWRDRWSGWRNNPVAFYTALTAISVWFTLGPPIGLWRWTYWMPVFSFLRVPSRFVLLEVLALAVLSGFGYQWLARRTAPAARQWLAIGFGALLIVEFAPMPLATIPYDVTPPAADRWLDSRPKPFVVAEVPVPDSVSTITQSLRNTLYMLHSTAHWQKIVHGYSGVEPQHYTDLHWKLTRFPDDESLNALVDLGVDYVVMHPGLYPETELADAEARFQRHSDWLRVEYLSPDGRVYSLKRPATPPVTTP
jgi:hypothetical protein